MKENRLAQFGTYDIQSLGDSMFATVFYKEISKHFNNINITLFSLMEVEKPYNDNSHVYSYTQFFEKNKELKFDCIVIGGGEFIHFHKMDLRGENREYQVGDVWIRPIKMAVECGIPIIINCVGVSYDFSDDEAEIIKTYLHYVDYISVRGNISAKRLIGAGIPAEKINIVADNLWLFNKFFDRKLLNKTRIGLQEKLAVNFSAPYVVVQYGTTHKHHDLTKQLIKIKNHFKIEIVLIPVNHCHEDLYALNKIYDGSNKSFIFIQDLIQPIEIMSIISGATIFIGTSLHGNLTAISYGVKALPIDMYISFASKIDEIFLMLGLDNYIVAEPNAIYGFFKKIFYDNNYFNIANPKLLEIQSKLENHFKNMATIAFQDKSKKLINIELPNLPESKPVVRNYLKAVFNVIHNNELVARSVVSEVNNGIYKFVFNLDNDIPILNAKFRITTNNPLNVEITSGHADSKEITLLPLDATSEDEFDIFKGVEAVYSICDNIVARSITIECKVIITNSKISLTYFTEKIYELSAWIEQLLERERTIEHEQRVLEDEKRILENQISDKVNEVDSLHNHIHAIQSTKGYRILELCRRITKRLLPHGSMRRGFAKYIYKILKFNYKALRYLYRNGVIATVKKSIQLFFKKKSDDEFIPKLDVDLSVPKKVSFDYFEDPIVSIIIPVYNQFDYTMRCLDSIRKNSGDIQYEIILADDMSDDQTQNIQNFTKNIVIVRNEVNLKFLKNCNNAVKYARGEFILFLNNDTIVMENWLRPLIDILVNDKSVGLVGSKLIYPDGRLQEAGGIIWADASGWNYGRGSSPTSSEYNYLRDVDYISGASIAISKQLWEEIGGFDERFAPAYYEDSDLAFEVKKRNLRVVYQPLSSVVHFEGVSHGCDINVGLKAYQIENKDKFFQKWKDTLAKENFPNAENLFLARDKSMSKKTILYVDHYVPHYDRDAGSRNTLSNLQILVSLGYNVKFLGDNFFQDEPYTTKLEQMGIEVLYGNYYAQNWKSWIKNNAKYINYALLSRPHIAPKYIDIIREFTDAKIIYHPHDLHYIRTMREYEITGDKELILKAEQLKKTELSLINKSDVTITVSSFEKEELKKLLPEKEVIVIPIYHYEKFNEIIKEFSNKRNLLFVGGFTHTPNEDGLLWFMNEVFSLVKAKLPEVKLYIVGSNPTDKVRSLISKDVMLESNVPDERLEELYSGCRVAIIPLRYGAGVKGKTIEAMSKCIGVVSTYVGLEGIEEIEKFQKPFDTPEDFSNQIIELYLDDEKLYKNINDNQECLKRFYTTEKAREIFKKVLR